MAPRRRHRGNGVTTGGTTEARLPSEGDANVLMSADGQQQKWIAKAPEYDRPHRHAFREEFYWCPCSPILRKKARQVMRIRGSSIGQIGMARRAYRGCLHLPQRQGRSVSHVWRRKRGLRIGQSRILGCQLIHSPWTPVGTGTRVSTSSTYFHPAFHMLEALWRACRRASSLWAHWLTHRRTRI